MTDTYEIVVGQDEEGNNIIKSYFAIINPTHTEVYDNNVMFIPAETINQEWKDINQPVNIEQIKQNIISNMSKECETRIYAGFDSSCNGQSKHYKCSQNDQANITGLFALVQAKEGIELICGLQNRQPVSIEQMVLLKDIKYKDDDAVECYDYLPEQIKILALDMSDHITEHKDRFYALRAWAESPERTVTELEGWSWGMQLD